MSAFFKTGMLVGLVVTGLLVTNGDALAHKVSVFAWVEAGQVHTQSKFSGGKWVNRGKIEVFDHQKNKILEGTTDHQGNFVFAVPAGAKSLDIILIAGMGHTNHWEITPQELGIAEAAPLSGPAEPAEPTDSNEPAGRQAVHADTIEQIVEKALDKKLAPLRAQMAAQTWGLRDLVGGLGYILGLMGLASYLHNRKKSAPKAES